MWGALIGAVSGLLSTGVPKAIKIYEDKRERKDRYEHEIDLAKVSKNAEVMIAYYDAVKSNSELDKEKQKNFYSGNKYIDALNGLVRPTGAFIFFSIFIYTCMNRLELTEYQQCFGSYVLNTFYSGRNMLKLDIIKKS